MSGSVGGLYLVLYTFNTPSVFVHIAPSPYTVSVGKAKTPPFIKIYLPILIYSSNDN